MYQRPTKGSRSVTNFYYDDSGPEPTKEPEPEPEPPQKQEQIDPYLQHMFDSNPHIICYFAAGSVSNFYYS